MKMRVNKLFSGSNAEILVSIKLLVYVTLKNLYSSYYYDSAYINSIKINNRVINIATT